MNENETVLAPEDPVEFYDIGLECYGSDIEDYTKWHFMRFNRIQIQFLNLDLPVFLGTILPIWFRYFPFR